MKPQIVEKEQIILAGISFFGDPFKNSDGWTEENEIGRLWNRFMKLMNSGKSTIEKLKTVNIMYEVHVISEEMVQTGKYEVFVGFKIKDIVDIPIDLLIKVLPATTYAIFTLKGEQISSDWTKTIFQEWMPDSGYKEAHSYSFQHYDERFKGIQKMNESELDVYIPIKKK